MTKERSLIDSPALLFGLIGSVLLFTGWVIWDARQDGEALAMPTGAPVQSRELHFTDHAKGVVAVLDAETGEPLELLHRGEGMFLRSAMRTFAHDRRKIDVGPEIPFTLAAWPDGHLTLRDPATGRVMELTAFGHDNAGAFEKYLTMGENG